MTPGMPELRLSMKSAHFANLWSGFFASALTSACSAATGSFGFRSRGGGSGSLM